MATYTLISSNVLSSSAASVTFSAIPATYTDLVVKFSARWDQASLQGKSTARFNGVSTTTYSYTQLYDSAGSVGSYTAGTLTELNLDYAINGTLTTSNTFTNGEMYIPSYTASQNKPVSYFNVLENNSATDAYITVNAELWRNTAAITQVALFPHYGNYVSGSSFYLYGISNA